MSASSYQMPRRSACPYGTPRRVGVEIEMSGIELPVIAEQLVAEYRGAIDRVSEYEVKVNGSALGDFKVDLDFEYLQKLGRQDSDVVSEWSRECAAESLNPDEDR